MTLSKFDGHADDEGAAKDPRLQTQLERVFEHMTGEFRWHTLENVARALNIPQSSVSARLRDLRKPRFGGFLVERQLVQDGLYLYRVHGGSGDRDLVRSPLPEPRSPKAEARRRLTEWLDEFERQMPGREHASALYRLGGPPITIHIEDLRALLA